MIKLLRSDDRLIHGQCQTQLSKVYDFKEIIVVDNPTASNPFLKKLFKQGAKPGIIVTPVTVEEAKEAVGNAMTNDVPTIVLTRFPHTMCEVYRLLPDLNKDFNVATVNSEKPIYEVTKFARLDQQEMDAIKEMDAMGVHIWFNLIPAQPTTEWNSIKSKY